jgi:hypothetical protein
MDTFHKILVRIYEISGGRDSQDVDFVDLVKTEGYMPSLENIKNHLSTESWITDSNKPGHVRITHWGAAEAKKSLASPAKTEAGIDRVTARLGNAAKDFSILVEEFIAKPSAQTLKPVQEKLTELDGLLGKVKPMV